MDAVQIRSIDEKVIDRSNTDRSPTQFGGDESARISLEAQLIAMGESLVVGDQFLLKDVAMKTMVVGYIWMGDDWYSFEKYYV